MRLPFAIILLSWILIGSVRAQVEDAAPTLTPTEEPRPANATPVFEIVDVNLGDQAWGLNCMKVRVRNTSDSARTLYMHISGKSDGDLDGSFGMGESHNARPGEQVFEHWYWLPPCHGLVKVQVMFIAPKTSAPWAESPFLKKTFTIEFPLPNDRCNNLMISDKVAGMRKTYPANMQRLEPFTFVKTPHFVLYFSPNTPAAKDIDTLAKEHEAALAGACGFFGAHPSETITLFFYPDRLTKKMCTNDEGDGLASGHTIAQVYNETTRLDPYHEITHVVAGEVGVPPAMFNEGLATWMAKGHVWNGTPVDVTAAQLLKDGRLTHLKTLLIRTEFGSEPDDGKIAYPQASSFVGYLVQAFGKEKFLELYKTLQNGDDITALQENITRIEEIYGLPLEKIEAGWLDTLEIRMETATRKP